MTFDYNQKQPVYEQLVDELRKSIKENYQPNDKLLSEREIMKKYSVSRNTVRQALNELEIIGYIYTDNMEKEHLWPTGLQIILKLVMNTVLLNR